MKTLISQGGTHGTWCDGENHTTLAWSKKDMRYNKETQSCDCKRRVLEAHRESKNLWFDTKYLSDKLGISEKTIKGFYDNDKEFCLKAIDLNWKHWWEKNPHLLKEIKSK